jgi:hypothetical protein
MCSCIRFERLAAVALLVMAMLNVPQAFAADGHLCQAYMEEALILAREVRENGCPVDTDHPQWSENGAVHKRWCMGAEVSSVDQERENRRQKAAQCRFCKAYADEAVDIANIVRNNACPVFDTTKPHPQWSTDPDLHKRWCMAANNDAIDHERAERRFKGNFCAGCREYARTAKSQLDTAIANKCSNIRGARWSDDENAHFKWCWNLATSRVFVAVAGSRRGNMVPNPAREEQNAREGQVKQCLAIQKVTGPLKTEQPRRRDFNAKVYKPAGKKDGSAGTSAGMPRGVTNPPGPGNQPRSSQQPCRAGQPCKARSVLGGGLLDSNHNLVNPGPAPTGTPIGGAGSGAPPPRGGAAVLH